ncbi:MAG: cupin domain-containing protein [Ilumatobacteraceae bacterium]
MVTADDIAETLGMRQHPEGGRYVETWRGPAAGNRPTMTAIYFLLVAGERSHWHRVDVDEVWLHHAGSALAIELAGVAELAGPSVRRHVLGGSIAGGERPQVVVPAGVWQSAAPLGAWTLASCVVAPGFEFDGFELAPQGWSP